MTLLFSSVLHFLLLKIYRIVNFLGKIDWSMNSGPQWAGDCQRYQKKYFHFPNMTKNGNKAQGYQKKLFSLSKRDKKSFFSAFQIVQTLLPFFVKFRKWKYFLPDPRGAGLHEAFQISSVRPYVRTSVRLSPHQISVLSYTPNLPRNPNIFTDSGPPMY